MSRVSVGQRRKPVQERSRQTVARILGATERLIASEGINEVTTRAIAEEAGVSAPSLYRFFADRDEIFDRLLSTMLNDLDAFASQLEASTSIRSPRDFIDLELDLHVEYYEAHPSYVRLWYGGRVSASVVEEVHRRNRELGRRARAALVEAGLVYPGVSEESFVLLVELGDRVLDLAFRETERADPQVIADGREALVACLEHIVSTTV